MIGVAIWYGIGVLDFTLVGRKSPVYSPEGDFAVKDRQEAGLDAA
jgi:hypothetical protein